MLSSIYTNSMYRFCKPRNDGVTVLFTQVRVGQDWNYRAPTVEKIRVSRIKSCPFQYLWRLVSIKKKEGKFTCWIGRGSLRTEERTGEGWPSGSKMYSNPKGGLVSVPISLPPSLYFGFSEGNKSEIKRNDFEVILDLTVLLSLPVG